MVFLIFQLLTFLLFLQYVKIPEQTSSLNNKQEKLTTDNAIQTAKIIKTSEETLGTYNSLPIYKFLVTDTLEVFEFDQLFDGNIKDISEKVFIVNNLKYKFKSNLNLSDEIFVSHNK